MKQVGWRRIGQPLFWLLLYLLAFIYCQHYFVYDYFYAEQFDFFRFSGEYACNCISDWGGLASYLAAFLMQFFTVPCVGPAIAALLFVGISWELRGIWKKMSPTVEAPLLYLLPSLLLLWMGTDFNYHWSGTIGLWISLCILRFCLYIPSFHWQVLLTGLCFLPAYYAVGPWMLTVLAGILLNNLFTCRWHVVWLVPWGVLVAVCFYQIGAVPEARFLFSPDAYYNPKLFSPVAGWYAAASCLLNLALSAVCGNVHRGLRGRWSLVSLTVQLALLALICWKGTAYFYSVKNQSAKQLDYYVRTKQWQEILEIPELRADANYLHACYQNLALAALDRLGDDLLDYGQCGSRGLVLAWDRTFTSSMLLSDVYYQMGNIALAQEKAFESMIASEYEMTPRLLLRLIQTNLIFGYDKVAEKYIRLLEQTWAYASEAMYYRQFLGHPERLEADAELGHRKRCVTTTSGLSNDFQIMNNLWQIMHSNPAWRPAFLYYGAICLLNKDVDNLRRFLEAYKAAKGLQPMPVHFQEAAIILHEKEEDVWADYGVSPEVANRFKAYRQTVYEMRKGRIPFAQLQGRYGNTYWFYVMFKR